MYYLRLLIIFFVLFLSSCSQNINLEKFMDKYDSVDFTPLKNTSIYFRSRGEGINSSIYFVNKYNGNCSPYIVEFNDVTNKIIDIKNNLVISSCKKDYLSKNEIELYMKEYMRYKLCLLQVDPEGNVSINPRNSASPTIMRKAVGSYPENLNQYKCIEKNWYVKN